MIRLRWCLLLLLAVSASAQRIQEEITVDIVEVPVHVTRRGKSVTGLTQDLFELSINGKRHPIEYFDVIDSRNESLPEVAPGVAPETPTVEAKLERRNMTVLLFDTSATSHLYLTRASKAAQKFVKDAPPYETFAVARLNADGVQFLVPFTSDRALVLRACRTLKPSKAGDVLGLATLESERADFTVTDAAPGAMLGLDDAATDGLDAAQVVRATPGEREGSDQPSDSAASGVAAANDFQSRLTEQIRSDAEMRAAKHLGSLAEKLAPINGVKHVILFAEGNRRSADPRTAALMHQKFHASGVILDAVELDSMRIHGQIDAERRTDGSLWANPTSSMPLDRSEPLYTLSLGTGGTVAKHSDISDGLRLLREIQGVTYVLGFRPPKTDKKHNDIKVKVKKQPFGTTVTYRMGYTTGKQINRNEGLFLADVMLNDIPQRGLTLDVQVQPIQRGAKVLVRVPGPELLAREVDGPVTDVDVFLYVFDQRDVVAAWSYWRLNIDLEKGREFLAANPYEIQRLFALTPGQYTVKALLRFRNTDVTGFQRADFVLAASASAR